MFPRNINTRNILLLLCSTAMYYSYRIDIYFACVRAVTTSGPSFLYDHIVSHNGRPPLFFYNY